MKYETLLKLVDGIAADFLFLDEPVIDIPATGKFMNHIEAVMEEAKSLETEIVLQVAGELNALLEKIIMDDTDPQASYRVFENGITIMQEIINDLDSTGGYEGDIKGFMASIAGLTGSAVPQSERPDDDEKPVEKELSEETTGKPEAYQVQDESLLRDFITEAFEYLNEIEVNVLNLEQDPGDKDYINAVFRPFHSVKGVASFLNLNNIRDLAHALENLLDKARSDEVSVTSELIDIILDGSDILKEMISSLREILDGKREQLFELDISQFQERIQKIIDQPHDADGKVQKLGSILVEEGVITDDNLEDTLEVAQKVSTRKIGEALIDEGKATSKQISQALRKQASQITAASTIRVDVRKLDDLIDMIGELVINQAMIRQSLATQTSLGRKVLGTLSQLGGITSELQRTSTSLRMVPIKQTFQRMSRLVRDLARDNGKKITVKMVGEDTEIDRNMIEEIYNPLVHMVRNSVDHGIETPEQRVRCQKPEEGVIQLNAYHRGGNIVIEISDDGRGLNKKKILAKAREKGLVSKSAELSESKIFQLLFLPGFSTAEKVTEISGRGVGMDVVKQAVDKLRGKIEVASTEGENSTFTTVFPLTLAIIDGMIVRVGQEKYIVPTVAIRQLLRPLREAYSNVAGKGEVLNVMGKPLPLLRLYKIFNREPEHKNPWEALVVIVEVGNRAKCVLVDEVLGKEEIVIKSLGEGFKNVRGIAGSAILGGGNVGLILDPEGLFELSEM